MLFPKTGNTMSLSMYQNPSYRKAITKAYHQGKRVKIVYKSGSTMSERKAYYYVIN